MKYLNLAIISGLCMWALSVESQIPQSFQYQAALRNASGEVLENAGVVLTMTIRQGNANGPAVYQETHNTFTNEFGLVNVSIGTGNIISGNMNNIEWEYYLHFLQTELNDGVNGTINLGTQQLMSVPYALAANRSNTSLYSTEMVLDDLVDVDMNTVEDGMMLRWNAATDHWESVPADQAGWALDGNTGTDTSTHFIGTTDDEDIIFKRNNETQMRIADGATILKGGLSLQVATTPMLSMYSEEQTGSLILYRPNGIGRLYDSQTLRLITEGGGITVDVDGNVGITDNNIFNPQSRFHIQSGSDVSLAGNGFIMCGETSGLNVVQDNNEIMARNNGATAPFHINAEGGNVAIGQSSAPSWMLTVNGSAAKPGGGSWTTTSDARLKDRVGEYERGLDEILKVRPVTFHYITSTGHDTTIEHVGVLAQELQQIAPDMVGRSELELADGTTGDYLSVDPSAFVYMLINGMQEQQKQIELLEEEVRLLKLLVEQCNK